MNSEAEITRLAKENETFQKIIETQQHTILHLCPSANTEEPS